MINHKSKCENCFKSAFEPQFNNQIGEEVIHDIQVGSGYSRTKYTFYQCKICGNLWRKCVDSGAGGHGGGITDLNVF